MAQKFTGYMGDLSPEQEQAMQEIESWVRNENILNMEMLRFDSHDILRFCRARKFDVVKVKLMLSEFAQWRKDENIDTLYETWDFPEMPAVQKALPNGVHKVCMIGRPIFIRRVGMVDFDAFFAASEPDRMVR